MGDWLIVTAGRLFFGDDKNVAFRNRPLPSMRVAGQIDSERRLLGENLPSDTSLGDDHNVPYAAIRPCVETGPVPLRTL